MSRVIVLYPCATRPMELRWYAGVIFAAHDLVCFADATAETVQRAAVVVDTFLNHRNRPAGLSAPVALLKRLHLESDALHGKVLVHINDEYGGRPLDAQLASLYCALYAPFGRVFRTLSLIHI